MSLTSTHTVSLWAWMAVCALLVVACGQVGISQEGAAEEEKTAQVTVWSDRFEIFLEHRLIVIDTPTKFITHVTDLTTLEPRREGALTFILRRGSEAPITRVEPAPARDGIHIPELTFPQPGEWIVSLRIPSAGQEYTVELPPFHVFTSEEEVAKAPEPDPPEGISFLKEQQWKIQTKTEPVATREVVERLRLAGVVSVRPGYRAAVTPPIAGHLMPPAGASLLSLGARTKAGQVLAMVQPHLTVFGIATRNGIMLVSHIRHLQEHEGVTNFRDAVFRGSMERLAPILMTALAAGLALIPLAISGEKPGNEIQTPMAIVILFGLLTSMMLNMLIVPALYLRFGRPVQTAQEGGLRRNACSCGSPRSQYSWQAAPSRPLRSFFPTFVVACLSRSVL